MCLVSGCAAWVQRWDQAEKPWQLQSKLPRGLPQAGLLQVFRKKVFEDLDKVQETVS